MNQAEAQQLLTLNTIVRANTTTYHALINATSYLPSDSLPRQRLWHIATNTPTIPICKRCKNLVKWDSAQKTANQKYRTYCSKQCQQSDPDNRANKAHTERIRYGIGKKEIVDKMISTNIERYGVSHAIQLDSYKVKQATTNVSRYGVDNASNIVSSMKNRAITCGDKYGVRSFSQQHLSAEVLSKINNKQWLENQHIDLEQSITQIASSLDINYEIITRALKWFNIPTKYYPSTSMGEHQIEQYVGSFGYDIITGDKSILRPKQLDILIPEKQIAIEVNGIYWHSELNGKNKTYHLDKTVGCEKQNIQLIHILENEWNEKQDIVKSMIANKLGSSNRKIHARKCCIALVDSPTTMTFLQQNHIQGAVTSSINIGLYSQNELVSVMTFSKSRFSQKHQYEMYRFCTALNTIIIGGASKMFSYFISQYKPISVVSYSDKRWLTGNVYNILNFSHTHDSAPNYWYFKRGGSKLLSRIDFQKHKLHAKLAKFDPSLSEWQNMVANGYDRIWDCGNRVWEWKSLS